MRRVLFRNILWLGALQAANYLFPLVTLPYLTRVLGPAAYGDVAFIIAFMQYFVLMVDYGFNLSATQVIAHQQRDKLGCSRTFWTVTACKLLLALGGTLAIAAIVLFVPAFRSQWVIFVAAYPAIFGSILLPAWLFQGLEKMGGIALCNVGARTAMLPFIFLLVRSPDSAWLAVLVQSMTSVAAGLLSLWLIRRHDLIMWAPPGWSDIREAFAEGWHVFISVSAISLYTNSNVFILGLTAGTEAVGLFVGADKIRQAAHGVTAPVTQAVYPRINVLMKDSRQDAYRMIRRLTVTLGIGTLLLSLLLFLWAAPIIRILLGDRFLSAVTALRWLAFLPFIIGLNNIFGTQTMLTLGMKREFSHILLVSGLLNLLLIIPLSWTFGASGAAAAVVTTETAVTAAMGFALMWRAPFVFLPGRGQ